MSILSAACCCASCGPNTALIVSQMANIPGTQYNFPAPFLMTIRAPIIPSSNICKKDQCCVPVGDDGLTPSCAGCGGTGGYGCCYQSCQFNHGITTSGSEKSHLAAYLWNGGNFTDLKVYDSNVCRRYWYGSDLGTCWQGTISGGCSAVSTTNLYQRNTIGDISWNNARAVANLGFSSGPNDGYWDKWYNAPQYVPQDSCAYVFEATGVFFRNSPFTDMGYKLSAIQTYPGVVGPCVSFTATVIQHLGFDYKIPVVSCDMPSGNCAGACVNPCVVMYLRVKITGKVNKSVGTGFVASYYGDTPYNPASSYGCNCVPPGAGGSCSVSIGSYVVPFGGKKNAGCSIVDSSEANDVRTDAYYRSYWNGSDTLKQWFEKPFSLYRISSAMSDVACGGAFDPVTERSYYFASQYTTGDCVNPTGGTLASYCASDGAGGCVTVPLEHVDFSVPIFSGGVQIGSCCKPTPGDCSPCRTYTCTGGPLCDGRLAPAPGCVDCSGNEVIELCKVCAISCVAYQACKTMPGGDSFTQADIDSMPCDWENIPLQITPVYNPLLPDVLTVKSLDACGVIVNGTGTLAGGTLITITGNNLLYATGVTVNGIACTDVKFINNGKVTAITPASATVGAKFVRVITPGGTSVPSAGDVFTYTANAAPATCAFTPAGGSTAGGTFLTLTGHNYTGVTSVTIGGIACTAVTVLHSGAITCITPAASPPGYVGARFINVTSPYGSATAFAAFYYS